MGMEMPEEDAGWQIPCCGQGPCRCCPVTQGMEEAEPHFPLCVCGQHWLWHRRDAVPVHSVLERCSSCQGKCGGSGDKLWVLCVSNMT